MSVSANFPSTYQNLLKFVEIWRSSARNKNAQFFWDTVYFRLTHLWWGRPCRRRKAVSRLAVCKLPSEDFRHSKLSDATCTRTPHVVSTANDLRTSDLRDEDELAAPDQRSQVDAGDGPHWVAISGREVLLSIVGWKANQNISYRSYNRIEKKQHNSLGLVTAH